MEENIQKEEELSQVRLQSQSILQRMTIDEQKRLIKSESEELQEIIHEQTKDNTQNPKEEIQIVEIVQQKPEKKRQQKHSVQIVISQIIQIGSGLSKHLVYHIEGVDNHGRVDAFRRYSQFQALNAILYQRWPGCFIPFITNKSQIKNAAENEKYVKEILANYLVGLSYSPHLYYRQEVQLFLRSPIQNMKEMFSQMPPLKTKDVISRFQSSFRQQIQTTSTPQHMAFIKHFTTSLRKISNNLQTLSQKALILAQSFDLYSKSVSTYGELGKRYEQLCLNEYNNGQPDKMIITKKSQNKLVKLQSITKKNPFYQLYGHLYNEERDAQAFIEVILASQLFNLRRDELQVEIKGLQKNIQQIAIGGTNIKVLTTRKSKEVVQGQLQAKQKKLVEERSLMIQIFNILEIVIATKAIQLFKKFKRDRYARILSDWANFVGSSNNQMLEAWKAVNTQASLLLK